MSITQSVIDGFSFRRRDFRYRHCVWEAARIAQRSLADLARGLAAISASDGSTPWRSFSSKAGAGPSAASGRYREVFGRLPERLCRKRFTIRSSSEWKVTTASRPPGLRMRSAAAAPAPARQARHSHKVAAPGMRASPDACASSARRPKTRAISCGELPVRSNGASSRSAQSPPRWRASGAPRQAHRGCWRWRPFRRC